MRPQRKRMIVETTRAFVKLKQNKAAVSAGGTKFLARQEFGNLWTLRDPQPSDSSIYLYLTLEVFQTYDKCFQVNISSQDHDVFCLVPTLQTQGRTQGNNWTGL